MGIAPMAAAQAFGACLVDLAEMDSEPKAEPMPESKGFGKPNNHPALAPP